MRKVAGFMRTENWFMRKEISDSTSNWGQHRDESEENVADVGLVPALNTHVVDQDERSSAGAEVDARKKLQRSSRDSREHHVAQEQRDVRDGDTAELERLALCSSAETFEHSMQDRDERENHDKNWPSNICRDDVMVVVVVRVDAVQGQTDVERKHSQR